MFSGIVEMTGHVIASETIDHCYHVTIQPTSPFNDIQIGDSIAVNGVCLTVTAFTSVHFNATIVPETLRLTNLQDLKMGKEVNLERSVTLQTRIGGHLVQGHVDTVSQIQAIQQEGEAILVTLSIAPALTKYIIKKGFIGIDGMSITVIDVFTDTFTVTFIPHTQHASIVNHYQVGTLVNIEVDMLAKYLEKLTGDTQHANRH